MIEFVYLIAIFTVLLLISAIVFQIRLLGLMTGIAMIIVGVSFITQGVGVTEFTNFFVRSTGVIFLGLGWFIAIGAAFEYLDPTKE